MRFQPRRKFFRNLKHPQKTFFLYVCELKICRGISVKDYSKDSHDIWDCETLEIVLSHFFAEHSRVVFRVVGQNISWSNRVRISNSEIGQFRKYFAHAFEFCLT